MQKRRGKREVLGTNATIIKQLDREVLIAKVESGDKLKGDEGALTERNGPYLGLK